jgi:hypothetical protein
MLTKKQIKVKILTEMIEAIDSAKNTQPTQYRKVTAGRREEYVERLTVLQANSK